MENHLSIMPDIVREVTATLEEYRHVLRAAFSEGVSELRTGQFSITDGETHIDIGLTPQPPRRIAALQLPQLQARIRFVAGTAESQAALLARLDRAMHRGGG